ncbi:hypothetical protein [Oceanibaculum nanhaiense]|uniref:hypothetical protein n=1 Tax=Oceanibaculum nanhaiense TaxID=1909734 RepID=UPI003D272300
MIDIALTVGQCLAEDAAGRAAEHGARRRHASRLVVTLASLAAQLAVTFAPDVVEQLRPLRPAIQRIVRRSEQ